MSKKSCTFHSATDVRKLSSTILMNCVFRVDLSNLFDQSLRFILEITRLFIHQAGEKQRGKKMSCIREQQSRGRQHPTLHWEVTKGAP